MGMQQPYYGQQQQMGGWGGPGGMPPQDSSSMLPPPLNPGAPADPETLKRLKEELLQQKQQTAPGRAGAAGGAAGGAGSSGAGSSKKVIVREAAGQRWVDPTLAEWPENDFRIFVGDLGNEVNDEALSKAFSRYPSFAKAKVSFQGVWCWQTAPSKSCWQPRKVPSMGISFSVHMPQESLVLTTLTVTGRSSHCCCSRGVSDCGSVVVSLPLLLQIIRDKKTKKSRGFGIVSLLDGGDFAKVSSHL